MQKGSPNKPAAKTDLSVKFQVSKLSERAEHPFGITGKNCSVTLCYKASLLR